MLMVPHNLHDSGLNIEKGLVSVILNNDTCNKYCSGLIQQIYKYRTLTNCATGVPYSTNLKGKMQN